MKAMSLVLALVAALVFTGCEGDCDCDDWCYDTYHVEGWCVWPEYNGDPECVCDLPCCRECPVGDGACYDICVPDENCSDSGEW